jgi:protoporphyrinogen oxidase
MKNLQKNYDYIVIGGGISGVAAARVLQQKQNNNFLLLESEPEPGGLCRTKEIDGHYLDIGGGHFLHSRFNDVMDWVFEHSPRSEWNKFQAKVLIDLEGTPVEFPIELNLWQLPTDQQVEYLYSYLTASKKDIEYKNFEDWIKNYLGDKIADNYMIPYNKKLWCIDPSTLNTDWLIKIPNTNAKLVLKTIIERNSNFTEEVVSHRSFYYPKEGGFQTMFNSIYEHIKDRVVLGHKTKKLEYDSQNKIWIIDDKYRTKNIINTAPWPVLDVHLNGFNFKEEFKKLKYLSDVISLWEREPYDHKAQWKYIPNPDIEQHREFYIHNYAPYSKPGGVMTDINSIRWRQHNKKWKAGIPLYEHENVYSYPMPTTDYKEAIKNILFYCRDYNLFGLGRWGQWQYFNTDQCIKQVLDFFNSDNIKKFDFFKTF